VVRRASRSAGAGARAGAWWGLCGLPGSVQLGGQSGLPLGYMCAYVSRVMRVLAWPRRLDTSGMGAPSWMSMDACVWRSVWNVILVGWSGTEARVAPGNAALGLSASSWPLFQR
jgi:hypothetical protein